MDTLYFIGPAVFLVLTVAFSFCIDQRVAYWFNVDIGNIHSKDIINIKRFILASGSLKEIAKQYSVTYPTVRLRLDRLIQKIQISENTTDEPFISLIKRMAVDEKLDFDTAKVLISEYKKVKKDV